MIENRKHMLTVLCSKVRRLHIYTGHGHDIGNTFNLADFRLLCDNIEIYSE